MVVVALVTGAVARVFATASHELGGPRARIPARGCGVNRSAWDGGMKIIFSAGDDSRPPDSGIGDGVRAAERVARLAARAGLVALGGCWCHWGGWADHDVGRMVVKFDEAISQSK